MHALPLAAMPAPHCRPELSRQDVCIAVVAFGLEVDHLYTQCMALPHARQNFRLLRSCLAGTLEESCRLINLCTELLLRANVRERVYEQPEICRARLWGFLCVRGPFGCCKPITGLAPKTVVARLPFHSQSIRQLDHTRVVCSINCTSYTEFRVVMSARNHLACAVPVELVAFGGEGPCCHSTRLWLKSQATRLFDFELCRFDDGRSRGVTSLTLRPMLRSAGTCGCVADPQPRYPSLLSPRFGYNLIDTSCIQGST
mmetsp:Transcript_22140/g.75944  ORF Transcript_22140/g.75944 Transcript_22140/m.75944 type:complete len:257 (+) Transcript_22140:267-1037(+)